MSVIQSKGRVLDLSQPVVMGILNATPNSFYNKGRDSNIDDLLLRAGKMLKHGAAILDAGGASTKPGEPLINAEVEMQRVAPVIEALRKTFPQSWISIDTYNAATAKECVAAGADIVNDVSSGAFDTSMLDTMAKLKVPYIAMHMQGTPETMQINPQYSDVSTEVVQYLKGICDQCTEKGIYDIIVDPGFGFGKTVEQNFQLLQLLPALKILGRPVLAGLSRKSMVCKPLKVNPEYALNGTTALNMVALQRGANILRVHDVKEAMQVITLWKLLPSGHNTRADR